MTNDTTRDPFYEQFNDFSQQVHVFKLQPFLLAVSKLKRKVRIYSACWGLKSK